MMGNKTFFEKKIKPILQYIGIIGASLSAVAYIILILILIVGFKTKLDGTMTIVFAAINAVFGIIIMQLLKIQGITFAKNLPENKEIIDKFNKRNTKERKFKSIKRFWAFSLTKDIILKATTMFASIFCIVTIVVIGSNDYVMLLMALINLIMFACFGFLSLNSAYDYYNDEHIPYIEHLIASEAQKGTQVARNDSAKDVIIENDNVAEIGNFDDKDIIEGDKQC